ncbi:MAG: 2-octaprenyl-6-methoxyphenol hydroxylase [Yoonia sp.]
MQSVLSELRCAAYVMGMEKRNFDIFISGGGVAGLTAAAAFGAAGFSVLIVDPTPPVTTKTADGADLRTTAFLQPAKAFLERAGLWDALSPYATPLQVMQIADASGPDGTIRTTAAFDAADISDAPFGWNLPNWLLRREMITRLDGLDNVTLETGVGFADMVARTQYALVRLTNGAQVQCKLVIGADGRNSPVRTAAGLTAKTTRYGQKALTFAVTHDLPHDNVSTEIHLSGGPFTLVPLPDHDGMPCSAVVWMNDGATIADLAALDQAAFDSAATARSGGIYGPLTCVSKRSAWPIISQIASAMNGPRTALVAEAAHVMPPIGAQGLNMSLADLACLLDLALDAVETVGDAAMLDAYHAARHNDVRLRVTGVDALNRASIAGSTIAQDLRVAGIKALHGAAPIRRKLMELGLGAKRQST